MRRRLLGYCRVSSVEQAVGTSLADQEAVIRAYARAQGIAAIKMFVEAASAIREKIERRDQIRALLSEVRTGDVVVVDKLDRWSRDPEFTYRSVREILGKGAGFYAVGDAVDPSTPEGDTALGFRILFAREEHKRIKQRMVGTRKLLRARGLYVEGTPPWGYRRRGGKGPARNELVVDREAAPRVRRAYRLCAGGASYDDVAAELGVGRDRVVSVLRTRVVLGEVRTDRGGEWIRGTHEPIVTPALWTAAQEAVARRRKGQGRRGPAEGRTSTWWTRDRARCVCGGKMSASYGQSRVYYRCARKCGAPYARVDAVEQAADGLVLARLLELREELARPPRDSSGPRTVDVVTQRERLAARRSRYVEAYADGGMTRAELRAALERVDAERTRLDAMAQEPARASPAERRRALRSVEALAMAWARANPWARRQIVNRLATALVVAPGPKVTFRWRTAEELAQCRG